MEFSEFDKNPLLPIKRNSLPATRNLETSSFVPGGIEKFGIQIVDLELALFVGWTEEERSQRQSILISIEIEFDRFPGACQSDQLEDTFCYGEIVNGLSSFLSPQPYRLLEKMGADTLQWIRDLEVPPGSESIPQMETALEDPASLNDQAGAQYVRKLQMKCIRLKLKKPNPPITHALSYTGISMEWQA